MLAKLKKKYIGDWDFYKKYLLLAIPMILQNAITNLVSFLDNIMVGQLGTEQMSGVAIVNQLIFVYNLAIFGAVSAASIFGAQYFGKGDMHAIEVVEGIALRFSLVISLAFASVALLIPELMMKVFTNDPELITLGASYLRFMSITYLCWGITEVYLAVLRSIGRVTVSMALNVLAFSLNIILNAVFIFGLFGAPKLGVKGVALATAISRIVELICCFFVSTFSKDIKLDFRYMFTRNKILFQDFIKLSLPALGNDVIWGVAFSTYSIIIGHLGSDAVAANSFVIVVRNFGTILCFGIASAGGILLGKVIGENRLEDAREDAKKLMKLTVISGALGGLLILAATPFVLKYASLSETAMHYLKYMLLINTYYVMGAAVNTTLIAGVFRAGGDSRFGFVCDTIDMWCYAVPLGFIAAFVFKLPVMWVYFLLCTDEFVKWPWVFKHYRSEKWLNNITRDNLFEEKITQE